MLPSTGPRRGAQAEAYVAALLAASGWTIIGRGVRCGRGELDIVAVDPGPPRALVVVEVRYRSGRRFGLAEESLDQRKRRALRTAVGVFRAQRNDAGGPGLRLPRLPLRVDLVVVEPSGAPSARATEATEAAVAMTTRHHRGISLGGPGG